MWHEARKQEKKIRGMLVDYRKRAERRQDFYERIKSDPTQFMQIHGRKCRIHLDPAVAAAGDGAAIIVPWQGNKDNLIDRFDVRAHLDFIPPVPKTQELEEISTDERQCNYERYRILAQNDFLGLSEEKFLHQLFLEEQYGANAQLEAEKNAGKKKPTGGATIGYCYDDDTSTPFSHITNIPPPQPPPRDPDDEDSDSDIDMDVSIDITKLDTSQAHELNGCGRGYGMLSNDFYSYLTKDADEADALRMAREEEAEKMMLSGRKSRRERRAQKERRVAGRPLSPPSYAAKEEPVEDEKANESDSRSPSPENSGKITYITSFGGEDELQPHSKITINMQKGQKPVGGQCGGSAVTYAQKVKENLEKLKIMNEVNNRKEPDPQRKPKQYLRSRSRSRSSSRDRYRRTRSRSRSRSRGFRRSRYRSKRTRSRSRQRKRSYRSSSSSSSSGRSPPRQARRSRTKSPIPVVKPPVIPVAPIIIPSPVPAPVPVPAPTVIPPPIESMSVDPPAIEPPPIKRYYGRKRENASSETDTDNDEDKDSSENGDEDDEHMDTSNSDRSNPFSSGANSIGTGAGAAVNSGKPFGKNSASQGTCYSNNSEIKASGSGKFNPKERLKRKMQILLNKQYKADKKAEIEKTERQIQLQQERDEEMRELALKLRRRRREIRHKCGTPNSSPSRSGSQGEEDDEGPTKSAARSLSSVSKSPSPVKTVESVQKPRNSDLLARQRRSQSRPKMSRSRSRSGSKSRRRSRSRSRQNYRTTRRSRSRSRGRRSASRRRERRDYSRDRARFNRGRDYDRGGTGRRHSRSRSRDRDRGRDRDVYNRGREYNQYGNRNYDRYADRTDRNYDRNSDRMTERERNNRNRIVICASPKLRKLVDYE